MTRPSPEPYAIKILERWVGAGQAASLVGAINSRLCDSWLYATKHTHDHDSSTTRAK